MSVVDSTDPFQVLNLSPTADTKEIKRAYKRMALKYHPDVVTNQESSVADRKKANDDFAKINWAYAQLSGKNGSTTSASSSSTSSSRSSYTTPPHRRTSSTYNPNQASTDWRDYMPKYDDDEANYDAGGDSFEKILSDLLKGAAVGAAGVAGSGGGIFRDFVEFLESNVDGYSSAAKEEDDAQLRILLTSGSVEEVGMEMDDTELVVQQLDSKRSNLADELIMRQADRKIASGYMEKMELDEKVAELEARTQVVDGYLKKARKRLLSLQTRYKQLIVSGENDNFARQQRGSSSTTRNTWDGQSQSSSPGASFSRGTSSDTSTTSSPAAASMEDNAWKHEGFGSSARGRGSSSRRSRGSSQTRQSSTSSFTTQPPPSPASQQTSTSRAQSSSSTTSAAAQSPPTNKSPPRSFSDTPSQPWTPPHRRTASTETQAREDKKRLRELQVDDAFDQLKKDLGL